MGGAFRRSCRNNRIKHITTHRPGSSLTQIQQYADAVLGRLNREDIETEITKSHDYKMLRAYALIPLDESDTRDANDRIKYYYRKRHVCLINKSSMSEKAALFKLYCAK